ncbi:MAG: TonB-dependent receptor [Chlorobi bacterium]|nr:TonB-dependent receptor [Chlorobiota bacterium]
MIKKIIFSILISVLTFSGIAQKYTISGYIKDANNGEELLYANIYIKNIEKGTTTNEYGFYSLTLPKGDYTILYSNIGYISKIINISLNKDTTKTIELQEDATEVDEVIINAERNDANVTNTEVSTIKLNIKDSKIVPVLFGEQDILKTMQLMPGVSASSEGSSGFFVRGGDSDQNLILLDEAPVYNASHLLGFFSVFNSDALKDLKIYKGGIPAQYGGRISSVTDIRMKNGNMKEYEVSGGIGLISSRLAIEGPIKKDNSSFIISGRRTYLDFIARAKSDKFEDLTLYFYDLNAKANINIGKKDRLYVSGYIGRDAFGTDFMGFDWGNKTATFRWNHIFSNSIFSNTSLIYSDFDYGFDVDFNAFEVELNSGIYDYNFKQDFNWYINTSNTLSFGFQSIYHKYKPMQFLIKYETDSTYNDFNENNSETTNIDEQKALENAIYISNKQKIGDRFSLEYGLRFSNLYNIGPYTVKTYGEYAEVIDSTVYSENEFYSPYFGLEPRINSTFLLNKTSSIKASYNRTYQYLHLLSNSTSGSPTDMWMPSTPNIKPEYGDQIALGYFRNFKNNNYEFSIEGFYKDLKNQVDFKDGADAFGNPDVEAELVFGKGRAYGLEFLLKKTTGKFTGWIAYTLLKSERKFDDISENWFSARQDRTHDISIVASYKLNKKITFSATWVYYTGDAVTFPTGKYEIDGNIINLYSERNGDRMPNYHRLDLGVTFILKEKKRFRRDLNISIYNAYNRKNAYSITFQENEITGESEAERMSLFGIVPSITWNFRF